MDLSKAFVAKFSDLGYVGDIQYFPSEFYIYGKKKVLFRRTRVVRDKLGEIVVISFEGEHKQDKYLAHLVKPATKLSEEPDR